MTKTQLIARIVLAVAAAALVIAFGVLCYFHPIVFLFFVGYLICICVILALAWAITNV